MDLKQIKNLLNLISESDVNEVYIEEGDFKIKIKKHSEAFHSAPLYHAHPAPVIDVSGAKLTESSTPSHSLSPVAKSFNSVKVKSPIVGTYYSSPSPDTKPFVQVGDVISKGQALCIIEAMKIMNEIESDVSGKIVNILVNNGQPVEFDQPLFEIEPS